MKIISHPVFLDHDNGTHPENRKRLLAFGDLTPEPLLLDGEPYLELVHPRSYVELVRSHCENSMNLDGDTVVCPDSFKAATCAVGATIMAMERGDFALSRPPGHHAYAEESHGFCLFNNVAVAAQLAVNQGKKVLIFDFDGHLGDGTMDIFYNSDQVLYWSIHQYPAYPGNGAAHEIGAGKGKGFTFNVPLPAGSGDDILLHSVDYMLPAIERFLSGHPSELRCAGVDNCEAAIAHARQHYAEYARLSDRLCVNLAEYLLPVSRRIVA